MDGQFLYVVWFYLILFLIAIVIIRYPFLMLNPSFLSMDSLTWAYRWLRKAHLLHIFWLFLYVEAHGTPKKIYLSLESTEGISKKIIGDWQIRGIPKVDFHLQNRSPIQDKSQLMNVHSELHHYRKNY